MEIQKLKVMKFKKEDLHPDGRPYTQEEFWQLLVLMLARRVYELEARHLSMLLAIWLMHPMQ